MCVLSLKKKKIPSKIKNSFSERKSSLKRFYKHNKPQQALVTINIQFLPTAMKTHQCVLKKFASATEYLFQPWFVFCGFYVRSLSCFFHMFTRKRRERESFPKICSSSRRAKMVPLKCCHFITVRSVWAPSEVGKERGRKGQRSASSSSDFPLFCL